MTPYEGTPGSDRDVRIDAGRLLGHNALWNLAGQGAPLLVAVFAIPILVEGLGPDRFGVLALAWAAVGYFSLFDFGLGRALTKVVSERLGREGEEGLSALARASLLSMFLLGLAGGLVAGLLSPWLVRSVLKIPGNLQAEVLPSFLLLASSLPIVIVTGGLRGILEAHHRFGLINVVRIPMGILTFAGPLAVLPFSRSIFPVVAVLAAGRLLGLVAHAILCLRVMPALRPGKARMALGKRSSMASLVRFGGWMTVSNVISPLMVSLDRFLIGALLSAAAVTYYATPYEVVTRLWIIPGALAGVLFPAFAAHHGRDDRRTAFLFGRGVGYVFTALFPFTLAVVSMAPEGMAFWLGPDFARRSTRVLQWLAAGVFVNSLAHIPFAFVQGAGRPDLTGKLHLIELPIYLVAAWRLIGAYGIEGAAIAWTVRVAADAVLLFLVAWRLLPDTGRIIGRAAIALAGALCVMPPAALAVGGASKGFFLLLALSGFALAGKFLIPAPEEPLPVPGRGGVAHGLDSRG